MAMDCAKQSVGAISKRILNWCAWCTGLRVVYACTAGSGYPSALPAMRTASSAPRRVPVLVIGAAMNGAVIPAEGNYK